LNEARLELTGAHIFFFQDALHLAATDSFRLAEEIIPFTEYGNGYKAFLQETPSLILPGNTLQEIMRVITPESSEVKIALEENQIFFEIDGVQIISRVINGKYPDYKQIIPQSFSLQGVFIKEDFQRAVKIASAFSSYNASEITLSFNPNDKVCTITSSSQEIGENKTVLSLEFLQGSAPLTITFNPRYILEGTGALSSEKILFLANTGTTPAALQMVDGENKSQKEYLYIIMPIRKLR
jgi:DNA polymerase-3 subunit beta